MPFSLIYIVPTVRVYNISCNENSRIIATRDASSFSNLKESFELFFSELENSDLDDVMMKSFNYS